MTTLQAWGWAPLLVYVLLLGLGLLADRVSGAEVPDWLLAPLGLGVAIVLVTPLYRAGASGIVATPVLALAAVAGLALARGDLRDRAWQPLALATGAGAYLLYMAPVALSGDLTWAGYNFVNDTAANFVLIDYLEQDGASAPAESSGTLQVAGYLATSGYPIGSHAVGAAVRPLTGAPVDAIYQPLLAVMGALTAMSLADIARRAGLRPVNAAVAAVLSVGGVLMYRYAQHGAIKELALTALCAAAAGLGAVAVERRLPVRMVALIAICCLAMVFAYSAAAGAYALGLGLVVLACALASPARPSWRHLRRLGLVTAGIAFVALLPLLGSTLDFAKVITDAFSKSATTNELGHLLRPLPVEEAAGIWLARDYRLGPEAGLYDLNRALVWGTIALAAAGVAVCVARRRFAPLVLIGAVGLPAAVLAPLVTPYIHGKLLMTLTPAVVLLALFAGFTLVQRRGWQRVAGVLAVAAVAGGVLASDLYTYRETKLAPTDRMEAMEDAAEHIPGDELWLLNEWEEFGKYFMRSARVTSNELDPPEPYRIRRRVPTTFGRWFDLDLQKLSYLHRYAGVIIRRSPEASRPPASFRMIYRNRYYEVWQRGPGPRVRVHLPLQSRYRATGTAACGAVARLAGRAAPGDRLVAARPARVAALSPFRAQRPGAWKATPSTTAGAVTPAGPGTLRGTITIPAAGRVRVWLHATGGRPYTVSVDGRRVGEVGQINSQGQWLDAGTLRLAQGRHRVEVSRPGASAAPGDAFHGELGPVALQSLEAPELISVAPRNARRLCGRRWDWVELVRG